MLIETRVDVNMDEVWDAVWGNDGQGFAYWVGMVRAEDGGDFHGTKMVGKNGDVEIENPQDFKVFDREEDKWHTVSEYDLAKAWVTVATNGWTHCGGHPLSEHDACCEDAILQYAVFGDLIYG